MAVHAGEIIGALESLEVARFKMSSDTREVLGFEGLGSELQPTIIVSSSPPSNNDGRPNGTIWVQSA